MELNRHRVDAGWLDLAELSDEMVAREGDVLTIYDLEDLGPRTVRAFSVLAALVKRGVTLDFQAVADDPWELFAKHVDYVRQSKVKKMHRAKQNGAPQGGRPSKRDIAIRMYNDIKENNLSIKDGLALHNISRSRFYEHIAELGWVLPKGDTSE